MDHFKKKVVGVGLAAAGFLIFALLVAGAAMGDDGGLADVRIADLKGSAGSFTAVTSSITYQGRLTDSAGNPLSGTYTIAFKLYEASSGGTALDTDTHAVEVTDGLFVTRIDFDQSYFDGRALWLGITVGADPEMTPLQELRPIPYALSIVPGTRIEGNSVDPAMTVINHGLGTGIQTQGAAIGLEATGMTGITGEGDVGVRGTGYLGSGIVGTVSGASNVNPGVLGENPQYSGVGVEGQAGFGTGVKGLGEIGVYGQSSVGPGVVGRGGPYGVYGNSTSGAGVYGTSGTNYGMYGTSTSTIGHGVHGEVAGSAAIGVYGKSSGPTGQGVAGFGTTGVYGNGSSIGVQGWSEYGTGVMGGGAANGVWGVSIAGSGLRGQGGQYGVYGSSENGMGVFGSVSGLINKAPAVYGSHQGAGSGVEGHSQDGYGVYGKGKEGGGYFTTRAAGTVTHWTPGVNISTQYTYNPGVLIKSSGGYSEGVRASTSGHYSDGVYANATGYASAGIKGISQQYYGGIFDGAGNLGIYVYGNIEKSGTVSFIEDHPADPTKEIVYVCLEGGETGTYTRGSGQLSDGAAVVQLPEHFSLVTSSAGLTVQVTPTSECKGLYVVSKSPNEFVVKELNGGTGDVTFDYLVNGIRHSYEEFQPIRDKQEKPDLGDALPFPPDHEEQIN